MSTDPVRAIVERLAAACSCKGTGKRKEQAARYINGPGTGVEFYYTGEIEDCGACAEYRTALSASSVTKAVAETVIEETAHRE